MLCWTTNLYILFIIENVAVFSHQKSNCNCLARNEVHCNWVYLPIATSAVIFDCIFGP